MSAATATALPSSPDGGDIPVLDWQGRAVDCGACPHAALRRDGGCEPGRSCMQDAYARRIDRFFRANPGLAAQHLTHRYFEVRAIAVRHVDVFRVGALLDDPDETVRLQAALRVPQRALERLLKDPHREVRIRVAMRLADHRLAVLRDDPDYEVRTHVARRLPAALLPTMLDDADAQVRCEVARRVPMPTLLRLAADLAPEVRRIVAQRLPLPLLTLLDGDEDVIVAHTLDTRRGEAAAPVAAHVEDADGRHRP